MTREPASARAARPRSPRPPTRQPGIYTYSWPCDRRRTRPDEPLGRWRWVVTATDDQGRSLVGRALVLAERHARLHARRAALGAAAAEDAHRGRRPLQAAAPARVTPSIWTTSGVLVRAPAAPQTLGRRHARDRLERPLPERPPGLPRQLRRSRSSRQNAFGPVDLSSDRSSSDAELSRLGAVLASVSGSITTFVGDHGVYAVFLLMAIDAVFPAASELVMVYAGALASGRVRLAARRALRPPDRLAAAGRT